MTLCLPYEPYGLVCCGASGHTVVLHSCQGLGEEGLYAPIALLSLLPPLTNFRLLWG